MGVYLESFSKIKWQLQAPKVYNLARKQNDWLPEQNAGAARRYRDPLHAAYNIRRLANDDRLETLIVKHKRHGAAVGLATVIFNKTVIHPELGGIFGNDLDYTVRPGESNQFHHDLARALIDVSVKDRRTQSQGGKIISFAALSKDLPSPPIGLMGSRAINQPLLDIFGEPASLEIPEGEDDFAKITKDGATLQLYLRTDVIG